MIELFQNQARRYYHVEINQLGWSAAEAKYPAIKSHRDIDLDGAASFKPEDFQFYKLVAKIDAETKSDAFYVQNNPFGYADLEDRIERIDVQHSMSVGDIVKDGDDYYMVDHIGFTKIQIN